MKKILGNIIILLWLLLPSTSMAVTVDELHQDNVVADTFFRLTWDAPTFRENGDALDPSEIQGYEIYAIYPDDSGEVIPILNGSALSYTVLIDKGPGTYTFAITTLDTSGLRSQPSDNVSSPVNQFSAPTKTTISVTVVCEPGSQCNFYLGND